MKANDIIIVAHDKSSLDFYEHDLIRRCYIVAPHAGLTEKACAEIIEFIQAKLRECCAEKDAPWVKEYGPRA